ncbi:MAG: mechanosensitive ion channel domain-containing protein, partial [Verrucomicrobiota bacterium]
MKSLKSVLGLIFILALANPLCSEASSEKNPLAPVKTDNPRATMRSFYTAMESYHQGLEENDPQLEAKITDAIRCLDTSTLAALTRSTEAVDAAIYLKEVLDRVIVLNYSLIPDDSEQDFWRLKDTEISTRRITEGDRSGEHLITSATVERAGEFFKKVEDLPYLKGAGQGAGYKEPLLQRMLPTWSTDTFAEIAYWQWIGLFFSLLLGLVVRLFARLIGNLIHAFTKKTATQWDDILIESQIGPVSLLVASLIWLSALQILKFEGFVMTVLSGMTQIVLVSSMIWVAYRLADVLAQYLKDVASRTENTLDDQIVKLISRTLKIFIVIMGVMLGAQNLGIDVFSLLAGLGIGGLAIALAAKDSLSNFFGSIMIMVDRPFQVGQWIKVGNIDGTVEDVGFRSTKIRTFYNSLVSIPNAEVANSDIDNMGLREYRRVKTTLGVAYDTPAEKMEAFLEGIKNIIKANPNTRKDYFHVVFNDFGPSSL